MLKLLVKIVFIATSITFNSLAMTTDLNDVTAKWTFRGEVISAFPEALRKVELKENYMVYKVFSGKDAYGKDLRVELFYTGDDAEFYPQFYMITNASESSDWPSSSRGKAYYLKKFSSPDTELGEVAPEVDPFDLTTDELKGYIKTNFLKADFTINL